MQGLFMMSNQVNMPSIRKNVLGMSNANKEMPTGFNQLLSSVVSGADTDQELAPLSNHLKGNQDVSADTELAALLAELKETVGNSTDSEDLLTQLEEMLAKNTGEVDESLLLLADQLQALLNNEAESNPLAMALQQVAMIQFPVTTQTNSRESVDASVQAKVNQAVENLNTDSVDMKALLATLKELSTLSKSQVNQVFNEQNQSKGADMLKQLLANFEAKQKLASQGYRSEGKVTTTDVSKWLTSFTNSNVTVESSGFGQAFMQTQSNHQLEQFTVHTSGNSEQLNQDLVQAFEKVMAKSIFGKTLAGNMQLKMQLTPHNLGQINVELTEVNGEMMVKLIATTDAAKEALEANMKELRHMFSPHNVVVEKEAAAVVPTTVESQSTELEQEDQMSDQENTDEQQDGDTETTLNFEDVLLNERV